MIQMDLFTKQKHTGLEDKLMVTELGNGEGGKTEWKVGIEIYTVLY